MMHLGVALAEFSVSLLKIEAAFWDLANQHAVYGDSLLDLGAAHFSFAPPMKNEPLAHCALKAGRFCIFRIDVHWDWGNSAHHDALACFNVVVNDDPRHILQLTAFNARRFS